MKVIIAGSREFDDFEAMLGFMSVLPTEWDITEVVSGGARGADRLGESFAHLYNKSVKVFPADWDKHGKSAGILRNREMADYADGLIAFWDGVSPGTKHMIVSMYARNKPVHICFIGHILDMKNASTD